MGDKEIDELRFHGTHLTHLHLRFLECSRAALNALARPGLEVELDDDEGGYGGDGDDPQVGVGGAGAGGRGAGVGGRDRGLKRWRGVMVCEL